jgi:hypothetical protein
MAEAKAEIRTGTILVGSTSGLSLLLAALGIYGVVAFADGVKLAFPGVVLGAMLGVLLSDLALAG